MVSSVSYQPSMELTEQVIDSFMQNICGALPLCQVLFQSLGIKPHFGVSVLTVRKGEDNASEEEFNLYPLSQRRRVELQIFIKQINRRKAHKLT